MVARLRGSAGLANVTTTLRAAASPVMQSQGRAMCAKKNYIARYDLFDFLKMAAGTQHNCQRQRCTLQCELCKRKIYSRNTIRDWPHCARMQQVAGANLS